MVLSKLFSSSRSRDKENEKKYIIKGYPLTTSPFIPDILKHQVEFKKLKRGHMDEVGLTIAHEGSDLAKPESLELFRKNLLAWYKNDQSFCKNFSTEFPNNVIAISFSRFNFEVGDSCQEYKLMDSVKPSDNGHFTYRKMSECIQCTYYNGDGVEFLAGITFFPSPHGKPQLLRNNNALLYLANSSAIVYPLGDRQKCWTMTQCKQYGRFCATSGKNVLLDCREKDGVPRHLEYNHVTNAYEYNLCKACCEEFYNYKWEPKEDTSATVTPAITVEEAVPAAVADTDFESSAVSRASSTESLMESFDKIDVHSEDAESDIDAELID